MEVDNESGPATAEREKPVLWKPALRETLSNFEERTHVRTTRTESTCDCGNTEASTESRTRTERRKMYLMTSRSPSGFIREIE